MKVGDKVYCINNTDREVNLIINNLYTVSYIYKKTECVELYESTIGLAYSMDRFITEKQIRKQKLEKLNENSW